MRQTRLAAVAGLFYPGSTGELRTAVRSLLQGAPAMNIPGMRIKALIVPHAGYVYSGAVAATAYAQLAGYTNRITRVVLLGPAHRHRVQGLALPAAEQFETPLGRIACDPATRATIGELPHVVVSNAAHAHEHSLEVQLPFLQLVLDKFTLVPIVVGIATTEQVSEVLDVLWGDDKTLIIVSSDLSHYLPYENARSKDESSVETILRLQPQLDHLQACGATPINGLIQTVLENQLQPHLLDLRNSGDTAGDKSRVVGYASIAFHEHTHREHQH